MIMMPNSQTIVIERNNWWRNGFETEPCEVAWAREAIFFIRALDVRGKSPAGKVRVQISPDGIYWCDEGTEMPLPTKAGATTFVKVVHFGGWLRLAGEMPSDTELKVLVYVVLKA